MKEDREESNKMMSFNSLCFLPFGKYNDLFEHLSCGEKRNLKDKKSDKNSSMLIKYI